MIDIEALKNDQQKKLEEALANNALAEKLPVPGASMTIAKTAVGMSWVFYKVADLQEAVALYQRFVTVPYEYRSGTFGMVAPAEVLDKRRDGKGAEVKLQSEGCPYISGEVIAGQYRKTSLVFFAKVEGEENPVQVHAELAHAVLTPKVRAANSSHNCVTFYKEYPRIGEDRQVVWAAGGEDSGRCYWLWCYEDGLMASLRTFLGYTSEA